MKHAKRSLTFLLVLLAWCHLGAAADPLADFEAGVRLGAPDRLSPEAARQAQELFRRAAAAWESQAESDHRLWYEAGNARYWGGEPALAIACYRRYLANDPFRAEAWENLAQARLKAGTQAPGGEGPGTWPWSLWLLHAASACLGAAALFAGLWILRRSPLWRRLCLVAVALGLVALAALALSRALAPEIAVLKAVTQGRKGDAAVYAPQPAQAWPAGQEAWITETRGGWARLRVGDTISWVPLAALDIIPAPER